MDAYVEIEQRIDGGEREAIYGRWDCGDLMLAERNGRKRLPNRRLDEIAAQVGKSRREIQYRMELRDLYPDREQLRNALHSLSSWREIIDTFPKRRREIYKRNREGRHDGLELSDGDATGDGWDLLLGRWQDRLELLDDGSVDLVVTDPPYPHEYLDEWWALGELVPRVLAKGGVLLCRCGHLMLHEYLDALACGGLRFGWIYAEPLPGSNVRFQGRKIAVSWQPWLAFSNGDWPSGRLGWHPDMLSESPRIKDRYVWGQKWTVAAELIQEFTTPDDLVLDPFAGVGTYGEAALSVGCRWIGIEMDRAGHHQAAEHLNALR